MQALLGDFMEKLVLIDGNSLINRAFYAMPPLLTKNGEYTNAVYGFMNMFIKMLSDVKPTYVAVAFDLKAPTFRHKMYTDYKATRKPMPEELRPQIPLLKDVLRSMNICVMEKEGSEADDIIGTIAKATNIQTFIYTGDKDSFQLVDEETTVYFTKRGITDIDVYNIENFKEKTGIEPLQVIELKSLMGDSSDNIPGVKGVGEKTALNLVQTYGSLDGVYAHIEEQKGALKQKLIDGKDLAYLSRTLATIDLNCGVDTDVEKMRVNMPFSNLVKRKFIDLEFKTLFKKEELFDSDDAKVLSVDKKSVEIRYIDNLSELPVGEVKTAVVIAEDKVSLYQENSLVEYVAKIRQTLLDDGFSLCDILTALTPLFTGNINIVLYNKKDTKHFLKKNVDVDLTAPVDDVSLMKYLVDFKNGAEKFSDVIEEYGESLDTCAFALFNIYNTLSEKLVAEDNLSLYHDVELPLSDVLYDMEVAGFKVDQANLAQTGKRYEMVLASLESEIKTLAGEPNLNVKSPMQIGDIIFDKLKLGKGKKTRKGYSTTAEILEELEDAHPIIPLILRYRQVQKLYSTYIEGFKPLIDDRTGLIHTSFNQTVTATGRLSSKEPNLQNIPVRDDEGRELRKFFVSKGEDRVLVGADYSQIELRLLAAFSGCKSLIDAFNGGKDIHSITASKVFGVPLSEVTPNMRRNAKAVNFGIIYGMSEYGLAKQLKISANSAREYITAYFKEYPEVKAYMDQNVVSAKERGYAITMLGRKRYIRELMSSNYNLRQFGERAAMNMPLQGSSADIIKLAMINVQKRLKKENLKSELILQVHDELIIDAFVSEQHQVEKILKEEMEGAVKLPVMLTVELGHGKTWFDAK